MANLRLLFIIKAMTVWNWLRDFYINTTIRTVRFYEYITAYFKNHHDTWLFIPGHTLPLPVSNLKNEVSGSWIYDNSDYTLTYCNESTIKQYCKFSWLSTSVKITDPLLGGVSTEYNIDDFIGNLRIYTNNDECPTLSTLFLVWCAHNKHWFNNNCRVEFKAINEMGDEDILNAKATNIRLQIRRNKIYSVIDALESAS
jgi:hypothetical protein